LVDTITESREDASPELSLLQRDERMGFRTTLAQAIGRIPQNYLDALKRDIARERTKEHGSRLQPMSDQERQTLCRARAALAVILRKECGDDNPYIRLLNQQRNSRVKRKENPATSLSGQRQEALLRKLLDTGWVVRSSERVDDSVEEAVVNYVHTASPAAPPSPEFRQSMRVLDLYKMDFPTPRTSPAAELYARARASREAGQLEDALRCYKACFDAEPTFTEALSEVGVMHSQMGNLRDALKIYLSIVERNASGEHRCRAATNASDIYLTWFDAGRQREKNIELAIKYALMAMERPTPMRACNLILAYAKDRFFEQARDVLHDLLDRKLAECPTDRLLQTLFQIRDSDLVIWWDWLDTELEKG
jgi:tetratricopeptide (TPR) repeat protein